MRNRPWLKYALLYGALYALLLFLLPERGCVGDYHFWATWAGTIRQEGLEFIYYSSSNYNPFFYYLLYLYDLLQPAADLLRANAYQIKALVLPFDFMGALLATVVVPKQIRYRWLLPLVLLLNPAYLYNTYIWGQIDSILAAFVLLSLVLALKRHPVSAFAAFALVLTTKLQGIIFLPLLVILLLPEWRLHPRSFFKGLAGFFSIIALLLLPHLLSAGEITLLRLKYINLGAVDYYALLSLNAYNLWYLLFPAADPKEIADTLLLGPLTAKQWGLLLFAIVFSLLLIPVCLRVVILLLRKERITETDWSLVLLTAGLIPVAFCFFNTQMHERYWHPALVLLAAYAFRSKDYVPPALCCLAYFLNLEGVLQVLDFPNYQTFLWRPQVAAVLFLLALIWGISRLYLLQSLPAGLAGLRLLFSRSQFGS